VTTAEEASLLGAVDSQHIAFGLNQGRVIYTSDSDFLRIHDADIEHHGIVYCHQQKQSIGKIIRGLELIWEALESDEMRNEVEYI